MPDRSVASAGRHTGERNASAEGRSPQRQGRRAWDRPAFSALLTALLALAGTLFLYREALQLPFFFDDMIHLRWLDWHSLPSLWTTAEGLGYYRPLTMSVWKVEYLLLGTNDPARLHLLNLLLHALNAFLAGFLAWRAYLGPGRSAYTLLTASILLTFPFSYQAVPSTSSLSKPLIATLTLGSALFYWEARRRHSPWVVGLSLLLGLSAPLAYETGVTVPLAILAVEALGYFRREFERPSRLPVLYMFLIWGVALPWILSFEPETGASLRLPTLLSLWQNGAYFVEGLLFPLTPLCTPLERILPVDRYALLTAVGLAGLAGLWAFYRWARQTRLFFYALSWFVVAVLPLWFMLDFSYVITSPRILYLGGLGSALLWAGVPVFLWTRLPGRWWPRALAVVGALGMLAFNVAYVRHKMALAETLATPLWQAANVAKAHPASASLLYLNVPAWIAPKEPIYRVGTEGLTFIPEYVRVQDFVYVNTGVEPEIRAALFDPVKQDWAAYIGYAGDGLDWDGLLREIRRADGVYRTLYRAGGLQFVEAGALEQAGSAPGNSPALARFGDQILLLDYQVEASGDELRLRLWWYCQQTPAEEITVFVHVYDEAGNLIAQADGYPLLGLFPAQSWQPGDLVRDVRYVAPGGKPYTLAVGWYHTATGQRLAAFDRQGNPVPDDALQIP